MVHMSNNIIYMNMLLIQRCTAEFMCSGDYTKRIFTDNHNYKSHSDLYAASDNQDSCSEAPLNQQVSCEASVNVTPVLSSIKLILMQHPIIMSIVKHQHGCCERLVNVMRVF